MTITRKEDPIELFEAWFAEAREPEPNDPEAMDLATATLLYAVRYGLIDVDFHLSSSGSTQPCTPHSLRIRSRPRAGYQR